MADIYSEIWYSNSGATNHICGRIDWCIEYEAFKKPRGVSFTDHNQIKALGMRTIMVKAFINGGRHQRLIEDVLYMPGTVNLFSKTVMAQKGYTIIRKKDAAIFYDQDDLVIII